MKNLILAFLFASTSWANTEQMNSYSNFLSGVHNIAKFNDKNTSYKCEVSGEKPNFSIKCEVPKNLPGFCKGVFVNDDCSLGTVGKEIKKLFSTTYQSKAKDTISLSTLVTSPPSDILQACPKYNTLSTDLKQNFWIWMLGALAAQENGCREKSEDKNFAGTFQLDASSTRRDALRPNVCSDAFIKVNYPGKNINNHLPNTRCAMAILATQIAPYCSECLNIHNKKLGPCVTTKESQSKCTSCSLCRSPSERREDLKTLSHNQLFCDKKAKINGKVNANKCHFQDLNQYNEVRSGLGDKSLKQVIASYPYCN